MNRARIIQLAAALLLLVRASCSYLRLTYPGGELEMRSDFQPSTTTTNAPR